MGVRVINICITNTGYYLSDKYISQINQEICVFSSISGEGSRRGEGGMGVEGGRVRVIEYTRLSYQKYFRIIAYKKRYLLVIFGVGCMVGCPYVLSVVLPYWNYGKWP